MNTRIDVISMANAVKRRDQFLAHAEGSRVPWQFFDAKTELDTPLPYNSHSAVNRFGRELSRGEIGCFASHYAVWRDLLNSHDEQRIVLEDDVVVCWDTISKLASVRIADHGINLVRFYSTHPFRYRTAIHRFLGPHTHLVQARGIFFGTQGYMLTRHAATRLVDIAQRIEMPVDWLMSRYWDYGFPNYSLFPFPIFERFVPSEIGDRSAPPPTLSASTLAAFARRVTDRLARSFADQVRFRTNVFGTTPDYGPSYVERTAAGDPTSQARL